MKISELSAQSAVSIASIKYYIREGVLAAGEPTAANQADYGEEHLDRLRLIRSNAPRRARNHGENDRSQRFHGTHQWLNSNSVELSSPQKISS